MVTAQREEALDPHRQIIDPHLHLWDIPLGLPADPQRFLLDEALETIRKSGHRITHSVFVECGAMYRQEGPPEFRSLGETEFAVGMAAMSASGRYGQERLAHRLVVNIDLLLGDQIGKVLDRHRTVAGERLAGVRFPVAWSSAGLFGYPCDTTSKELLVRPELLRACRQLSREGLVLDVWCLAEQLGELAALADRVPDLTIVLDHLGTVDFRGADALEAASIRKGWAGALHDLAMRPNIRVKLGGLGMEIAEPVRAWEGAAHSSELAETWRPWIETAIDAFGPERTMFESNFPTDRPGANFCALWNAFKRVAAPYSAPEQDCLFRGTAAGTYRIEL